MTGAKSTPQARPHFSAFAARVNFVPSLFFLGVGVFFRSLLF